VALKDPATFKLIGKPVRRLDNAPKINGSAIYSIDMLPPGLLYASVKMCPTLGGKVARLDAAVAQSLPGVRKVITLQPYAGGLASYGSGTGGVAVIADTPFHAMRAVEKVTVEWIMGRPPVSRARTPSVRFLKRSTPTKAKRILSMGTWKRL